MPRYIAGVVKPQAASPSGATAISPPLPPSARDVGEHRVERLLQRLAAEPHALGELVRGDGADEIFARAGRGDRGRAVVGIGAGADQRRIADPAPALGGQPAGRGGGRDMAVDVDRDRADRAIFDLVVERRPAASSSSSWRRRSGSLEPAVARPARARARGRTGRRPRRTGRRAGPAPSAAARG